MKTILAQLIATYNNGLGYITYVFKCLDEEIASKSRYIMCVRYPNWDHREITLGEIGFLNYLEVTAGIDTWYNGEEQVPYKYTNIQFIKFIKKPKEIDTEYVM